MLINWEELFKQENNVFHCETEEIANKLLIIAHNLDYKWTIGDEFISFNAWEFHKKDTCYNIKYGLYSSIEYWSSNGFDIINVNELLVKRKPFKLNRK